MLNEKRKIRTTAYFNLLLIIDICIIKFLFIRTIQIIKECLDTSQIRYGRNILLHLLNYISFLSKTASKNNKNEVSLK